MLVKRKQAALRKDAHAHPHEALAANHILERVARAAARSCGNGIHVRNNPACESVRERERARQRERERERARQRKSERERARERERERKRKRVRERESARAREREFVCVALWLFKDIYNTCS